MEEKLLLYSLLLTSIFNLIVLLVLTIAIVRLGGVMFKLSLRVNDFLEKSEKEIKSVGGVLKGTLSKSDQYVNAAVRISERYMAYRAVNKLMASPKTPRIVMMALGIGFGLFSAMGRDGRFKKN